LRVTYNAAMQPLVRVSVGEQWLDLVFDASSGDTLVFVSEDSACRPQGYRPCYSFKEAQAKKTVHICAANNAFPCDVVGRQYTCDKFLPDLHNATAHGDKLVIDGLSYDQKGVEALDAVELELEGSPPWTVGWPRLPVRLLVKPLSVSEPHGEVTLRLFEGAGGLLGASGPTLSCRGENLWGKLLARWNATLFALDFQPPPQAHRALAFNALANASNESRLTLGQVDPRYEKDIVWSQPKQTGDQINDAMSEFLIYHPTVCGVDLLYNTSSNWLTVLDTSGPCLLLPPFLFDRLRAHVPMTCPFAEGNQSLGRLCSPRREDAGPQGGLLLPALRFQLEDNRDLPPGVPPPRVLELPLERLVFQNASGHEFLCISRDDDARAGADMLFAHVSFGSLAASAMYTAVDLQTNRMGLASKGNASTESTDRFCSAPVTCKSPMQTYYPPLNVCEDPVCSKYLFMTLDGETKTCIWYRSVPALFGVLLAALVMLDFLGHRLYAQATEKAAGLRVRQ